MLAGESDDAASRNAGGGRGRGAGRRGGTGAGERRQLLPRDALAGGQRSQRVRQPRGAGAGERHARQPAAADARAPGCAGRAGPGGGSSPRPGVRLGELSRLAGSPRARDGGFRQRRRLALPQQRSGQGELRGGGPRRARAGGCGSHGADHRATGLRARLRDCQAARRAGRRQRGASLGSLPHRRRRLLQWRVGCRRTRLRRAGQHARHVAGGDRALHGRTGGAQPGAGDCVRRMGRAGLRAHRPRRTGAGASGIRGVPRPLPARPLRPVRARAVAAGVVAGWRSGETRRHLCRANARGPGDARHRRRRAGAGDRPQAARGQPRRHPRPLPARRPRPGGDAGHRADAHRRRSRRPARGVRARADALRLSAGSPRLLHRQATRRCAAACSSRVARTGRPGFAGEPDLARAGARRDAKPRRRCLLARPAARRRTAATNQHPDECRRAARGRFRR